MDTEPDPRIILPVLLISAILFTGVYWAYNTAKSHQGSIVLPGGITYLGPSSTPRTTTTSPHSPSFHIPIPIDTAWAVRKGQVLPYAFEYPETLSLGVFPNDPYDSITVFYEGTDTNANIFFRVDNLTALKKTEYIGKPMEYAQNWWRDYAWSGVASVSAFTTSNGLSGYRASHLTADNTVPYDHVFLQIPGRNDLIIWMSGKLFEPAVFDRMVDSVTWQK